MHRTTAVTNASIDAIVSPPLAPLAREPAHANSSRETSTAPRAHRSASTTFLMWRTVTCCCRVFSNPEMDTLCVKFAYRSSGSRISRRAVVNSIVGRSHKDRPKERILLASWLQYPCLTFRADVPLACAAVTAFCLSLSSSIWWSRTRPHTATRKLPITFGGTRLLSYNGVRVPFR